MTNILIQSLTEERLSHALILQEDADTARSLVEELLSTQSVSPADFLLFEVNEPISIKKARQVVDFFNTSRFGSSIKVVFIPQAELMTNEAANALLKVLEEPPLGAHIILATTQLEKLLPTIRSRCQILQVQSTQFTAVADVPLLAHKSLIELFDIAKQLAEKEVPLTDYLAAFAKQDPTNSKLQQTVLSYVPHATTNVNRRLLLDNFFLQLYTDL